MILCLAALAKFNAQKLAITFISVSGLSCKSYLLCLEFADEILIFAVLERRLYNEEKLKPVFVFIIIIVVVVVNERMLISVT